MTHNEYIASRFREYFPNAVSIDVYIADDGETITVEVAWKGIGNFAEYVDEVGSDDDCFDFVNSVTGRHITVPFQPDEPAEQAVETRCPIFTGKES